MACATGCSRWLVIQLIHDEPELRAGRFKILQDSLMASTQRTRRLQLVLMPLRLRIFEGAQDLGRRWRSRGILLDGVSSLAGLRLSLIANTAPVDLARWARRWSRCRELVD